MAANQITYVDKETYLTSALLEKQKLTSADANEIKNSINANAVILDSVTPVPAELTDGAAIALNFDSKYFQAKRLNTAQSAITLTLSDIVEGSNLILSVKKTISGNVTITLAGAGLSFYGYNDAAYSVTPDVVLIGATNDIFDISFYAREATVIGVAIGVRGN